MKTFWEVIGIILTVIALAGFILTVVYLVQNYDAAGGFSGVLRNIAVSASLMAGVTILWVIRYQVSERSKGEIIEEEEEEPRHGLLETVVTPVPNEPEAKDEMTIERKPEFRPEEGEEIVADVTTGEKKNP